MLVMDGRMRSSSSSRQPFTPSQWQELELQSLIFNYMALGIPIPSHLILPFRRNFPLDPFPFHPSMSFERRAAAAEEDPETWRCKRTDGKKWRCSREAFGDSKYCERHKHRGKKCTSRGSSSSSSFTPPLLGLYPHPVDSQLSSLLGDVTSLDLKAPYGSSIALEERKEEHCFVFGADLKLQTPANVAAESSEGQSPKLRLSFFPNGYNESCMIQGKKEQPTSQFLSLGVGSFKS